MAAETGDSGSRDGSFSPVVVLALALGVLLAVRLLALTVNRTDLFFDEAQYWSWSREPAFGYYSKPPLIAWIIGLAISICGDGTACIRAPAPIMHTATAAVVYLVAVRLHGARVGLWSALAFATLPGVSLSSGIISTDVPLLLCWALALWGYVAILEDESWWPAMVLGVAVGAGLNAKYAMGFFTACIAVHLASTPSARRLLLDARLWTALAISVAMIAPNLAWNLGNGFATFSHTADNAKWGGALGSIGKGFEFMASQLAVFGPILLVALLVVCRRAWLDGLPDADRMLLAFSLPVLILITVQGFLSRAHANWAAVSYVAGTVLVTASLVRFAAVRWLKTSLALHTAVLALLAIGTTFAGTFALPLVGDPFQRTIGWQAIGKVVGSEIQKARNSGPPFRAVMADDRSVTAELLYYLRHETTPVLAWRDGPRPHDHYEMTRPFRDASQVPVLLVSTRRDASRITGKFGTSVDLGVRDVPAGKGEPRKIRLFSLSDYRGG